jgi:anaerobic selenocysteine-containing dehydrogenase
LVVDTADGVIVAVRPDKDNPVSRGYSCPKGRAYGKMHSHPDRLLATRRRRPDGSFEVIDCSAAIVDIAARLQQVIEEHGPNAVGVFRATQSYFSTLTRPSLGAWLARVGTSKLFSSSTIDQSAKSIATMRMGRFDSGLQDVSVSDVQLLVGINPLVSHIGGHEFSFPICDPLARLREAKARGMKLIVVDPRRTETANHADVFLQALPGEDAVLLAAFLHVILDEGLYDEQFCDQYVTGLESLRAAVSTATPELAAERTGLSPGDIIAAATLFGSAQRGCAVTGTGPDMAPRSNLTEHLVNCLNAVGGRYLRSGEVSPNPGVFRPRTRRAQVTPPSREWESGFRSRIGGHGTINGELPSAILADEMLEPGEDRIRALIVVGGNPAVCLPDQERAVRALSSLDLLVTIDPYMTETARLAHYVIAPAMALERPDHTMAMEVSFPGPFAQYAEAVVAKPPGVVEEWEFFWELAERMGIPITADSIAQAAGDARFGSIVTEATRTSTTTSGKPTSETLLARLAESSSVPLAEIRRHRHGAFFDARPSLVAEAVPEAIGHRLDLLPDDVAGELAAALGGRAEGGVHSHLLVSRRMRDVLNSLGRHLGDSPSYNPAFMHPDDLGALQVVAGDSVTVTSRYGSIVGVVRPDPSVRRGVVSMSHCWGWLPGESHAPTDGGSNTARLISTDDEVESINRMPRMSAVPVTIEALSSPRNDIALDYSAPST